MSNQSKKKIKIFVSMHDQFYIPENELLEPIQVGASLADKSLVSMIQDNQGENISDKNKMYCELTAQYWAWKNMPDLDYYGFFHYRRYLSFNPAQLEHWENIVYFDYCDDDAVEKLMLNEKTMRSLIEQYDVIYPQENPISGETVYEHWCNHLVKKDLDIMLQVIMEKYPEFYDLTREVINAKQAIHCNMFIMKKECFQKYNEWLFDILGECEKRIDFSEYSTEQLRTIGHMAERLCAIYGKYLQKEGAKSCYVQRSLFRNNEISPVVEIQDEENQVTVVLSCDNSYVKYTSVLLESIFKNASSKYNYRIYVMHKDITKENMKILQEQASKSTNFRIEFIDIRRRMANHNSLFVDRHLSVETYYRFLSLEVFPNLSKILYLDCDIIVENDIAKLFNTDICRFSLGAVRDIDIISLYPKENEADPEVHSNIDNNIHLEDYKDYFQAGVLLFNLEKIRKKFTGEDIFAVAAQKKWKFQDQDVLNYLFKREVLYLDLKWNVLYECFNRAERVEKYVCKDIANEYKKVKNDPWIIHYAGTPKPWDNMQVDMGNHFWNYAKTSPFFEELIHEMNIKIFNSLLDSAGNSNDSAGNNNDSAGQAEILKYQLDEIRKSFSYRLAMSFTYLPRKILSIVKGE